MATQPKKPAKRAPKKSKKAKIEDLPADRGTVNVKGGVGRILPISPIK